MLGVLRELIRAFPARRDTLAIDSCTAFLNSHATRQSYYTIVYLRKCVGLLAELHRDSAFHFCVSAVQTVAFLPAFFAVCDTVKRANDREYSAVLIAAVSALVTNEQHKRALAMIGQGPLTREILAIATETE
jgi:hypothetical protein